MQKLRRWSTDCNFLALPASQHKEEAIRDAFIGGVASYEIRQRLLEENNLSLDNAISEARCLEAAHKNAELFSAGSPYGSFVHQTAAALHLWRTTITSRIRIHTKVTGPQLSGRNVVTVERNVTHATNVLLATCFLSGAKKGHFYKVCRAPRVASNSKSCNAVLMEMKTNAQILN